MEISVRNLMLEVTRKCNMKCNHCLRGKAQDVDMSKEIIDNVLEQIKDIEIVTFTGGEPTMNMDVIEYFTKSVINETYMLQGFWMATNAKEYSPRLVNTLLDLYAYCIEYSWDDYCGLAISQDKFHDAVEFSTLAKYKALSFYDDSKETDFNNTPILDEGYANENGIGTRKSRIETLDIEFDDDTIIVDQLYINAKGDVVAGCDYSYETQEKIKLGNIIEESLLDILKRVEQEFFSDSYVA
jgi:MoaA/NifB/PqqE/SkfB family radical SAM enzyme